MSDSTALFGDLFHLADKAVVFAQRRPHRLGLGEIDARFLQHRQWVIGTARSKHGQVTVGGRLAFIPDLLGDRDGGRHSGCVLVDVEAR